MPSFVSCVWSMCQGSGGTAVEDAGIGKHSRLARLLPAASGSLARQCRHLPNSPSSRTISCKCQCPGEINCIAFDSVIVTNVDVGQYEMQTSPLLCTYSFWISIEKKSTFALPSILTLVDSSRNRTFSRGYPNLMCSYGGLLEPRGSNLTLLKSTFNAEHFICTLSWSILNGFGAIQS